jgi:hypothetical protein
LKICLSQELLDNDELSPVKVVRPANMIDQFLTEAKRVSLMSISIVEEHIEAWESVAEDEEENVS